MHAAAWVATASLVGALIGGCSRHAHRPDTGEAVPTGERQSFCGASSWVAGVTEFCAGHLVYRDYVYDDHGADHWIPALRWPDLASKFMARPAGDARYPRGAENTADLIRLELWIENDRVEVRYELNTLYTARQTIAGLAIDTDGDLDTGGGRWPGFGVASRGWEQVLRFDDADPAQNLIRGSFPVPPGARWRVWAVTAQADGTVMNVAFRGRESAEGAWPDTRQAAALAANDISAFHVELQAQSLREGLTRGAVIEPGFHERVYTSAYTLPPGEGISVAGVPGPKIKKAKFDPRVYQNFQFRGRYQPYAVYRPARPGPQGLQLMLHGFSQTHRAWIGQADYQRAFGDRLNRVLISPLGRGMAGAYSDISERDVVDVMDDAIAAYAIDASRVVVSGISMGGYGALQMATLYPDRFAGYIGWVSPTGNFKPFPGDAPFNYLKDSFPANTTALSGNLLHVPGLLRYGALDPLVPFFEARALRKALEAQDATRFDFDLIYDSGHLTTLLYHQDLEAAISADWQRPARVARVRYRYEPALENPALDLSHDRAYWISMIRSRSAETAEIDLHSAACGLATVKTVSGTRHGRGPGHLLWRRSYRHAAGTEHETAVPRLSGDLRNVASLQLDADASCLRGQGIDYAITTDGAASITINDGRRLDLPAAGLHEGTLR